MLFRSGFALEILIHIIDKKSNEVYFWSTHSGAEVDLFWKHGGRNYGAEFKFSDAPGTTKSMRVAMKDLDLEHLFVIYPGSDSYALDKKISVISLLNLNKQALY